MAGINRATMLEIDYADLQRKYDDALIRHEEIEVKLRAEIEELSARLSRLKAYIRNKVVPMLKNIGGF